MWEVVIQEGVLFRTERLKVPGGWLVRTSHFNWSLWRPVTMTFMPDPTYVWQPDKKI